MTLPSIQVTIKKSERMINHLHGLIHSTFAKRDDSKTHYKHWENACAEFHDKYDSLVFSCGEYQGERGLIKLLTCSGIEDDCAEYAREFAVSFIELRPYYFRSGYLYKKLLRKLKYAPLSPQQHTCYQKVKKGYRQYRENKPLQTDSK